ncbi:MAG TPA: TRAP transporter small permease subunit [Aestuariivirgaceae bacterium]|jgi:TRAP-type mannitol/chloroaromatic compound transport system permease small subunit|nr:TRAP transporter small permease subunit [Aestuariivirgaceae bacterium]
MQAFLALSRAIDAFSRMVGVFATYLVLFAALVSAFNAFARYSINSIIRLERELSLGGGSLSWLLDLYRQNSNTLGEAQWYMFAGMVMFGAAHTLRMNEHVRVDLVYGSVSERARLWIDLLGGIFFLLPMCLLMIHFTWPWFLQSYYDGETSANAGGLLRWPVKLTLPLGFALIALQGFSEIIKCLAALNLGYRRDRSYERPVQ